MSSRLCEETSTRQVFVALLGSKVNLDLYGRPIQSVWQTSPLIKRVVVLNDKLEAWRHSLFDDGLRI